MINKRNIFIPLGVIIIGVLGCSLFSGKTGNDEVVLTATEVGKPVGEKVAKDIGPEGGMLISQDGKLTVTIPKNAVIEKTPFSIQSITNTAETGIGVGYRLEPSGKQFTTPLKISVRYDDMDIAGTVPEALALAYQDDKGAWHSPTQFEMDGEKKTLTVAASHFSSWVTLAFVKIYPMEASVYVGDTQFIKIAFACPSSKLLDWYSGCSDRISTKDAKWTLRGAGTLTRIDESSGVVYTAPATKPADNIAYVRLDIELTARNRLTGEVYKFPKTFETQITILDAGYRASGESHDEVYTGVVCDLNKPFSVNSAGIANIEFKFVPASATAGKVDYTSSYMAGPVSVSESGSGTYTATAGGDGIDVVLDLSAAAHAMARTVKGGGNVKIHFTPLQRDDSPCVK